MLLASPFKICMIYLLSIPPKKTKPHFFIISPPKKPFSGGFIFPQTSKVRKLALYIYTHVISVGFLLFAPKICHFASVYTHFISVGCNSICPDFKNPFYSGFYILQIWLQLFALEGKIINIE